MSTRVVIAAAVRVEDLLLFEGEHLIQHKHERDGLTILTFGGQEYAWDPCEPVTVERR